MERLAWDLRCEHGQTQPVDEAHVNNLVESLKVRPPTAPIRVTAWRNEADGKLYLLSGQHLTKAVSKLRQEREQQGLQLEHWHKVVEADILKFETPLWQRQIAAGASNASTRLHRGASLTECLRLILKMEGDKSLQLSEKICRAVEQCGLNAPNATAVRILSATGNYARVVMLLMHNQHQ